MARSVGTHLFNAFRGGLIGTAEVVPGVSGGTVALVVGIYDDLIISAGHLVSGLRAAVTDLPRGRGSGRAKAEFALVRWPVVLAALAGMAVAVLTAARLLSPLVKEHPEPSYAVFFGLVLASLWVPYSGSGERWRTGHYLLALAVAVVVFVLTGLPPAQVDPNPLIVLAAAAVAICALVLPGVSGSFILLTLGLYTATMDAVNARDLGYLGTFALGALLGLAFFVKLLQWLLERHHHLTLVVMTGLLLGSLRALWPWQDEQRTLLAPGDNAPMIFGLMALGFAVVVAALLLERRTKRRRTEESGRFAGTLSG
ncbi:putative membrane protein [Amycolatopsis arida]|uniref:Putative membrane protein n=1 Tax=Amycolatopsis arida TaxID=587909 RepID=A0A1I5T4G9_9PSEU|nr:DUF368 domain-containing protein [Amycolatopsis arida]TDX96232.1 putative membrane protein [Amycolatopsis arida]SFP77952.1 putative membrane protein [Amycolatopsis arida]